MCGVGFIFYLLYEANLESLGGKASSTSSNASEDHRDRAVNIVCSLLGKCQRV